MRQYILWRTWRWLIPFRCPSAGFESLDFSKCTGATLFLPHYKEHVSASCRRGHSALLGALGDPQPWLAAAVGECWCECVSGEHEAKLWRCPGQLSKEDKQLTFFKCWICQMQKHQVSYLSSQPPWIIKLCLNVKARAGVSLCNIYEECQCSVFLDTAFWKKQNINLHQGCRDSQQHLNSL